MNPRYEMDDFMNKLEPYFALSEKFCSEGKYFRELINTVPKSELEKFASDIADTEKQGFERLTNDVCCFMILNWTKFMAI